MSRAVSHVVVAGCFSTPARPTGDGGPSGDAVVGPRSDAGSDSANVMFVSKARTSGSTLSEATTADTICRSEAGAAKLADPGSFVAYVSMNRDVRALLAGSSGWVRADGAPFANTVTDITAGRLFYPPRLDVDGTSGVALGAVDPKTTALSAENCDDWTSSANDGLTTSLGRSSRSSPMAFKGYAPLECGDFQRVYCFESDP